MKLSRSERETSITFNPTDETMTIYTTDKVYIRKMDRLVANNPAEYKIVRREKVEGEVIAIEYKAPKKLLTLRAKSRSFTDEQKKKMLNRLDRMA